MQKRNPNLDVLRTVAVMLVLGSHLDPCPSEKSPALNAVTSAFNRGGWVGVDLFFVLSGFLVSGLLFREYQRSGRVSVKTFLIRRGFKIYPAFYFFLAVTILVRLLVFGSLESTVPTRFSGWLSALAEATFLQNYFGGLWAHTWSLAVEEHFYFGVALLTYFMVRQASGTTDAFRNIPKVFLAVALFCFCARLLTAILLPDHPTRLHVLATHARIDSLMFGVLISYYYHFKHERYSKFASRFRFPLILAGICMLSLALSSRLEESMAIAVFGLTVLYVGAGALLVGFKEIQLPKSRAVRLLSFLGTNSYSVYLWHVAVGAWGIETLRNHFQPAANWFVYAPIYIVGSWVVGVAMAKLVEQPSLRIREAIFPSGDSDKL